MSDNRIVIVGTTVDYIERLGKRFPGRLLFITDTGERKKASAGLPAGSLEFVCDLTEPQAVLSGLRRYLDEQVIRLSGVVSYDCESLSLAAHLAEEFSLSYPSPAAIINCRSKYRSKEIWAKNGVACPQMRLVKCFDDVATFFKQLKRPVICKPLTGSGSELIFLCESDLDCLTAYRSLATTLPVHPNIRMYGGDGAVADSLDPRYVYLAEEFIQGREFSCDFILDGDRFDIIRVAKKIPAAGYPVGTTMAYIIPGRLPGDMDYAAFRRQIETAARTLGLTRAIGMVDFVVRRNTAYLLELTPRPGGDCLPDMMMAGADFDILGAALDFAEGKPVDVPPPEKWSPVVGLRLFASRNGQVVRIGTEKLSQDKRVLSCLLKVGPGHRVIMPPDEYESQLLGHVVFRPSSTISLETECRDIASLLTLEMESPSWPVSRTS